MSRWHKYRSQQTYKWKSLFACQLSFCCISVYGRDSLVIRNWAQKKWIYSQLRRGGVMGPLVSWSCAHQIRRWKYKLACVSLSKCIWQPYMSLKHSLHVMTTFYSATSELAFSDRRVVLYGQLTSGPLRYDACWHELSFLWNNNIVTWFTPYSAV